MNKSIINKIFDKVVCINLTERPERKTSVKNEFDKFGIDVEFYHPVKLGFANIIAESIMSANSAIRRGFFNLFQPNEVGCAISHYTVIKQAYLNNVENLFIFEDDIKLTDDFNNKFEQYYKELPKDWNMILLYSFLRVWESRMIPVNNYWRTAHNNWSCVAYGMNRNFMKQYIDTVDNFLCIADMSTLTLQEKMKCYVSNEFLVTPNLLESDIRRIR